MPLGHIAFVKDAKQSRNVSRKNVTRALVGGGKVTSPLH